MRLGFIAFALLLGPALAHGGGGQLGVRNAEVAVPSTSPVVTPADAGSIAYVYENNVWLALPDGGAARQLTTDGTPDQPYREPIQVADGSILVFHGPSEVDHLDRSGTAVGAPVPLPTLENGADSLAVSPDGQHMAYVTTGFGQQIDPRFGTPSGTFIYGGMDVAMLDGTSVPGTAVPSVVFPTWLDTRTIAASNGTDLVIDTLDGHGNQPATWLSQADGCLVDLDCPSPGLPAASFSQPVASLAGTRLAYAYAPYYGQGGRQIAAVANHSDPPMPLCLIPTDGTQQDPGTFSPDGSSFAWDDSSMDQTTLEELPGKGIWVLRIDASEPDCGVAKAILAIPDGSQPNWSSFAP
jgi:hypothetical protein